MPSNEYRVQTGDTLAAIARRYHVSMDVLARTNGLSDVNRLYVGQVLKIPEAITPQQQASTQPQTYRVRAGELLEDIAVRLQVSSQELCEANGITDPSSITVGQVLNIPKKTAATGKKPTTQQPEKNAGTQGGTPSANEIMEVAFRITGAFEGGKANSYQNQDSGIVSYGKHQATLASGTLGTILQKYVDQSKSPTAKQLSAYMGRVNKKDEALRGDAGFKKLLLAAADDPVMGTIQDAVFAENFWGPAEQGAKQDQVKSPLALAMYYDTNIQGGLSAVRKSTAASLKGKQFSEAEWLTEFNTQRDQRLKKLVAARRKAAKESTSAKEKKSLEQDANWIEGSRVRVADLQKLVAAGDLQLRGDKNGKLLVNQKQVDGLGAKTSSQSSSNTGSPLNTASIKVAKPTVVSKLSANYGSRGSTDIDAIILHHTASNNAEQDLVQLTRKGTGVSAHYLIAPDGTIYQLVDDSKRAWHAGVSAIRGEDSPDVNSRSIGIELTNDGRGKTPFTEEQYTALEQLVPYLAVTYQVPGENILGHRDVAPGRKTDPADNFDWGRVRSAVDAARGGVVETRPTDSKPTKQGTAPSKVQSVAAVAPLEVWQQLEKREGKLENHQKVYDDGRGFLTAGLGHKLTPSELARYKKNDTVPMSVLKDWARADIQTAYNAAVGQARQIGAGNQSLINALACVNFQLGTAWYEEHKKTWAYLLAHKWEQAATEAANSKWYRQTPTRVEDFQAALRAMAGTPVQPIDAAGKGGQKPDAQEKNSKTGQGIDLKEIARNVHDAMEGIGTDEQRVYDNLSKLNHDATLIKQFKGVYQALYQADVVEDIKSDFSNTWLDGDELDRALSFLHPREQQENKGTKTQAKSTKPETKPSSSGPPEKSGKHWVSRFLPSSDLADLKEPFQSNVRKFFAALHAAGIKTVVNTTLRPPQRSYLMYYAREIKEGRLKPDKVPAFVPQHGDAPVNIDWTHRDSHGKADLDAAKKAAEDMDSAYGAAGAIGKPYHSNHNGGEAIDVDFRPKWGIGKSVVDAQGTTVAIKSKQDAIKVGATYSVYHWNYSGPKAKKDDPHWSKTGN